MNIRPVTAALIDSAERDLSQSKLINHRFLTGYPHYLR